MNEVHIDQMLAIYSCYVENSAITFEYEIPGLAEWKGRIEDRKYDFPILVAIEEDKVIGYSYAGKLFTRIGYRWSAESSVYIHPDYHGKGVGKILYRKLIEILTAQGFKNVIATITIPNPKSEQLHHSLGFNMAGTLKNIGYKFNQWFDLRWYQLIINENNQQEIFPIKFKDLNPLVLEKILQNE